MNNNGKNKKNVYAVVFSTIVVIVVSGVFTFSRRCEFAKPDEQTYVFDGWVYGRDDQKKACAVLAETGLNDYTWHSGKLSVPVVKKGEYQAALASAGAYPKAPSESRGEALREMSVFESDAKSRMRELDACALQLERTIGQMRGVDYATVGVRSRREQVGLSNKNIVTASVGVAYKEGFSLDRNAIEAITLATKHQLGIEDVNNISILDFVEGKSWLGIERAEGNDTDLTLMLEQERIEKYWRDKYLTAFGDIRNIRVSVNVDLEQGSELSCDISNVPERKKSPSFFALALEKNSSYVQDCSGESLCGKISENGSGFLDLQEDGRCGVAFLGNPIPLAKSQVMENCAKKVGLFRKSSSVNGCSGVLREEKEDDTVLDLSSDFFREQPNGFSKNGRTPTLVAASMRSDIVGSNFQSSFKGGRTEEKKIRGKNDDLTVDPLTNENVTLEDEIHVQHPSGEVEIRSIYVHIGLPRSYVLHAARQQYFADTKETFATKDVQLEDLYEDTVVRLLDETKRYAIALFRPTGSRLGWSDLTLERSFEVDVFSDIESFATDCSEEFQNSSRFLGGQYVSLGNNLKKNGTLASTSGKIAEISTPLEKGEQVEDVGTVDGTNERNKIRTHLWQFLLTFLKNKSIRFNWYWIVCVVCCLFFVIGGMILKRIYFTKTNDSEKVVTVANEEVEEGIPCQSTSSFSPKNFISDSKNLLDMVQEEGYNDKLDGKLGGLVSNSRQPGKGCEVDIVEHKDGDEGFVSKRKEVLELISRYPDRAVTSLQNWVKGSSEV